MEICYHWHNVEHSDALQDYARKKIEKLGEHFEKDFVATARFKIEKNEQFYELSLSGGYGQFVASAIHAELYAAIDLVEAKLEKQIRRHKEKIMARRSPH